ncbi:TPA: hypothetical protein VDU83_006740 [Pseudomonas aeruginosa]|nr:hypothetical protein [Pseudomonas aeruginosa]
MLQPYRPISTAPEFIAWEDEMTYQIELGLEVDRSDAEGIGMAQQETVAKAWAAGLDAKAAADLVILAATATPNEGAA